MMKEEFENRVGFEVTVDEYTEIEKTYMANNFDKDIFCENWLKKLTEAEYKTMRERVIKPPKYPMRKGSLTNTRLMSVVLDRVKMMPEFKRAEPLIDYMLPESHVVIEITKYEFNFVASASHTNCSEGIYIDCYLEGKFDSSERQSIRMGTVKTLKRSLDAMLIMGELAGLLTWVENEVVGEQICLGYFEQQSPCYCQKN